LLEEVQKLGGPVPLVAFANHDAGGDVESCEQRGCAMPNIGMGSPLWHAPPSSAGPAALGRVPESGSSRRRSAPAPDWVATGKARRCREPCRRTKDRSTA